MSETQSPKVDHHQPIPKPGDRLQAARISIGLTLDDVASKMHLSTAILRSLEENNFDEITAPIFVKGYLRSYARIVNLDEEEIIEQYSLCYTQGDPPISSTSNAVPEINSTDLRVKMTTWLVIILLLGLLSMWWWNRYQQPAQSVSLDTSQQSEILADAVNTSDANRISLPHRDNAEGDTGTGGIQATDSVSIQQDAREELVDINKILSGPQLAPDQDTTEQQAAEPEPTPVEITQPATSGSDLVITVNADTWADIKDADGNKLVYDLLKNGEQITLSGKAPFRAFLGNGYGVSIQYKGKTIDLSNNIRADNTARINIGQ